MTQQNHQTGIQKYNIPQGGTLRQYTLEFKLNLKVITHAETYTISSAARHFDVDKGTVARWMKKKLKFMLFQPQLNERAYFINGTRTRILRKFGPWTFRKSAPSLIS